MQTSFHSTDGDITVEVHRAKERPTAWLILRTGEAPHASEMVVYRAGPLALEQILDLGYEIVNAARKLMPQAEPIDGFVPGSRRPTSLGEEYGDPGIDEHVPFAINDAIEHDEAMEAGIDSDLAERL